MLISKIVFSLLSNTSSFTVISFISTKIVKNLESINAGVCFGFLLQYSYCNVHKCKCKCLVNLLGQNSFKSHSKWIFLDKNTFSRLFQLENFILNDFWKQEIELLNPEQNFCFVQSILLRTKNVLTRQIDEASVFE